MLNKTGAAYVEEAEFSSPLAGEAFTKPVGGLPYDRPAVHADPQQALEVVFYSLSQPNVVRKLLSVLSAGIPIDYIVAPFLSQIAGEGAVSPHTATLIAPAVTVMLARMWINLRKLQLCKDRRVYCNVIFCWISYRIC